MTRQDIIAKIKAIAARTGYPADLDYHGDAEQLAFYLPDSALSDSRPGARFDVFEDGDRTDPPQPLTGRIYLQWGYSKPNSYLTRSLWFLTNGVIGGGFDVQLNVHSGTRVPGPEVVWQRDLGPNKLFLGYEPRLTGAKATIDSLFAAYFAD